MRSIRSKASRCERYAHLRIVYNGKASKSDLSECDKCGKIKSDKRMKRLNNNLLCINCFTIESVSNYIEHNTVGLLRIKQIEHHDNYCDNTIKEQRLQFKRASNYLDRLIKDHTTIKAYIDDDDDRGFSIISEHRRLPNHQRGVRHSAYISYPATQLVICQQCKKISTPKKIYDRYDITNWEGHKRGEWYKSKTVLCTSCWNKVKPISKLTDEIEHNRLTINRAQREIAKWQKSQTQDNCANSFVPQLTQ